MTKEEIFSAAKHSYENRDEIEKSKMCGCYYCNRTFPASLIMYDDYTDRGWTALCPLCSVDSVIGDASGVPINKKVLTEISNVMFESESLTTNVQDEDDKYGLINEQVTETIPCKWSDVEHFSEGLAVVVDENQKYGYINKEGKLVIPCKWEHADSFKNGQARVFDDEYNMYPIDKSGNIMSYTYNFKNDMG